MAVKRKKSGFEQALDFVGKGVQSFTSGAGQAVQNVAKTASNFYNNFSNDYNNRIKLQQAQQDQNRIKAQNFTRDILKGVGNDFNRVSTTIGNSANNLGKGISMVTSKNYWDATKDADTQKPGIQNFWSSPANQFLAKTQKRLETGKIVDEFKPFNGKAGPAGDIAEFGINLPGYLINSVYGQGITAPVSDITKLTLDPFRYGTTPKYKDLNSGVAKLGMQIGGQLNPSARSTYEIPELTAQEVIGNIGQAATPILDAWGGGQLFKIGKAGFTGGGRQIVGAMLKSGSNALIPGGASVLSTQLSANRNKGSVGEQIGTSALETGMALPLIFAGGAAFHGVGAILGKIVQKFGMRAANFAINKAPIVDYLEGKVTPEVKAQLDHINGADISTGQGAMWDFLREAFPEHFDENGVPLGSLSDEIKKINIESPDEAISIDTQADERLGVPQAEPAFRRRPVLVDGEPYTPRNKISHFIEPNDYAKLEDALYYLKSATEKGNIEAYLDPRFSNSENILKEVGGDYLGRQFTNNASMPQLMDAIEGRLADSKPNVDAVVKKLKDEQFDKAMSNNLLDQVNNNPAAKMLKEDLDQALSDTKGEIVQGEEFRTSPTSAAFDMTGEQAEGAIKSMVGDAELEYINGGKQIITPDGQIARGKYYDSIISVLEQDGKVESKTVYHEAFHAYVDKFVDKTLYKTALDDAMAMNKVTEKEASELLAEGFADYMKGRREGFTGAIINFFQDLVVKLRTLMGKESAANMMYANLRQGNRGANQGVAPKSVVNTAYADTVRNGGVTINLAANQPTNGFAYSPYKGVETIVDKAEFSPQNIRDFITKNQEILAQPGNHIGMWESDGKIYMDVSQVGAPNAETLAKAQEAQQLAAFDLGTFEEIPLGTIDNGVYNKTYEAINHPYLNRGQDATANLAGGGAGVSEVPSGTKTDSTTASEESFRVSPTAKQPITQVDPVLNTKKDVPITDIYGNKAVIPQGEALTPYQLPNNKVLIKDGDEYIVSKNQYENLKGQSIKGEGKPFAPELDQTHENVYGKQAKNPKVEAEIQALRNRREELLQMVAPYTDKGLDAPRELADEFVKVTERVQALEEANRQSHFTRYEKYTLPGGENYREILVKAPPKDAVAEMKAAGYKFQQAETNPNEIDLIGPDGTPLGRYGSEANAARSMARDYGSSFTSNHWSEPDVITHVRVKDRFLDTGEKVAFVEEIQSDWAREARAQGLKGEVEKKAVLLEQKELADGVSEFSFSLPDSATIDTVQAVDEKQARNILYGHMGVDSHPLLKNWQETAIKRALKEAVDSDAEYIAWTNGKQQANRYELSKHIEDIEWLPHQTHPKERVVSIRPHNGSSIDLAINEAGVVVRGYDSRVTGNWIGKNIREIIGKGIGDKIADAPDGHIVGTDLDIGGEWATNLYDKQIKNIIEDITGGKVETIDMDLPSGGDRRNWKVRYGDELYFNGEKALGVLTDSAERMKAGNQITDNSGNVYTITDVLGNGQFKAIPQYLLNSINIEKTGPRKWRIQGQGMHIEEHSKKPDPIEYLNRSNKTEFFSIDVERPKQQALKITPEIRAMVNGEAPALKQPSGKQPFEQEAQFRVKPEDQVLPQDLKNAKPRYGYGDKKYELNFTSDLDKALYIIGNTKTLSARDADYLAFAQEALPNLTEAQIRALGSKIKEGIKPLAAAGDGGTLDVPSTGVGTTVPKKAKITPETTPADITPETVPADSLPTPEEVINEIRGIQGEKPLGTPVEPKKGQKKRGFIETVQADDSVPQAIKEAMDADPRIFYDTYTNNQISDRAIEAINNNYNKTLDEILDGGFPTSGIQQAELVAKAVGMAKHEIDAGLALKKSGNMEGAKKHFDRAQEITINSAMRATPLAQGLQAYSLWNRVTPEGMLSYAEKEVKKANDKSSILRTLGITGKAELDTATRIEIAEKMKAIQKMEDGPEKTAALQEVIKLIGDKIPLTASEIFDAFRYQNLLSNPLTHFRNFFGNNIQALLLRPATMLVEGGIDPIASKLGGRERRTYMSDVPTYYKGLFNSVPLGLTRLMDSILKDATINQPDLRSIRQSRIPRALTLVPRFLEASDRFFGTLIEEGEYAALKSRGVADDIARKQAHDSSQRFLFRNEIDPKNKTGQGNVMATFDKATDLIYKARSLETFGLKPVSWFVPFIKTPMNIAKMQFEYSPLGYSTMIGNTNKTQQFAKASIGTAVTGIGALFAFSGRTTWGVPQDKKERELFYASGRRPYSVLMNTPMGERWMPMQYLGPLALAFAIPASMQYYQNENKTALTDTQLEKAGKIVGGLIRQYASNTYLSGLGDFLRLAEGDIDMNVSKEAASLLGQAIPLNGLIGYVSRVVDPIYRKPEGFVQSLQKNIPFASKSLPFYEDLQGNPSERLRDLPGGFRSSNTLPYGLGTPAGGDVESLYKNRQGQLQLNAVKSYNLDQIEKGGKIKVVDGKITGVKGAKEGGDLLMEQISPDDTDYTGLAPETVRKLKRSHEFKYAKDLQALVRDGSMSEDVLNKELERRGITKEDIIYDEKTLLSDDVQLDQIKDEIDGLTGQDYLAKLVEMRRVSEGSRKPLLSDTLIGKLEKEGYISESEADYLKTVGWDEKTKSFKTLPGTGGKGKKVDLSIDVKYPSIDVPKLKLGGPGSGNRDLFAPIKIKRAEALDLRIPESKYEGPLGPRTQSGKISAQIRPMARTLNQLGQL